MLPRPDGRGSILLPVCVAPTFLVSFVTDVHITADLGILTPSAGFDVYDLWIGPQVVRDVVKPSRCVASKPICL